MLTIAVICFSVFIVAVMGWSFLLENRQEQVERVEIVEKRIAKVWFEGGDYEHYYVSFKFPNGTIEEFLVGMPNISSYYDHMRKGDTGKLTYKINSDNSHGPMVSFEKDPEYDYGAAILEPFRGANKNDRITAIIISVSALLFGLFFIAILIVAPDIPTLVKDRPKQSARVKVLEKRKSIFEFRLDNGSIKEIHIPNPPDCDTIQINDTGVLTYKEVAEIEKKIKKVSWRWRGRLFISFEKDL